PIMSEPVFAELERVIKENHLQ
ncbi:PTS fructose transporter subunit IIB, partial [Streptococcus pyogenes]